MTDGELRGWFIAVVVLLILNAARAFFPAYLGKKGQNLADKEDIAELTRQIEGVKSEYTMLAEQFKAKHQLRVAALDKRLAAHQEAFTFWRKLMAHAYSDDIVRVVLECQEWWEKNCLYLEPEAREAFSMAYTFAANHKKLVDGMQFHGGTYAKEIQDSWKRVVDAGQIIMRSVALPPLTSEELQQITPEEASGGAAPPTDPQ